MSTPPTVMSPRLNGRRHTGAPVVVLHDVRSRTERRLIAEWARAAHPGATVLGVDDGWLADQLDDDALLVPTRVAWVATPQRNRTRRASDVLAHLTPRRPWTLAQPLLARRAPGAVSIVVGEAATLTDLRCRFESERPGGSSLEEFIARAAILAIDRAERRLVGDRYKVPRRVAEQIASSAGLREKVATLAASLDRPYDAVFGEVQDCLAELVAVQSPAAIDAYRTVLAPMHARAWRVHVDQEGLAPLRALNRNHALVFLPAHRSYADPLVLGEVLHANDFPRNHILGGNNMAIWPIGPLGKRAGVVFIRRANAEDLVYKLALREYLAHLAAKRFNLEWYIEGGRTRTGKLRPPKFGLLAYLTRALKENRTDDVQLVPVSIVYDHMYEVLALSDEQGGTAKAAEGTRWLARYVRGQLRNRGNAWVRFGEPFSLRQALEDAGEGNAQLEKVAFRICDGINRATPMTPTALVTFALLGTHNRALTLAEVRRVALPLLDYLDERGVAGPAGSLRSDARLLETLDQLVDVGVATRFADGPEPVWSVTPGQHRVAAFYRNAALHHLVTRAIVELTLLEVSRRDPVSNPVETAYAEALRLRDLLKFEFFFSTTEQFRADVVAELELIDPNWFEQAGTEAGAARLLASSQVLVAHRAFRSFFDAQLVVAEALRDKDPAVTLDEDALLRECLGLGQQMWLRGRLHRADSVSRELYATALRLARHRGLVVGDSGTVGKARTEFATTVRDVLARMSRIADLEQEILAEGTAR
jgi:glycerol-3-phosphate O-acyltransferase